MKNSEVVGKYIIIKDLQFSDYMKDEHGKICVYNNIDEAEIECGMYEFEDVLIVKILENYKESP